MSIWNSKILEELSKGITFKLDLNEGNTLLEEKTFNKGKLNIPNFPEKILFKREDKNPTGSFKDRSICFELSHILNEKIKSLSHNETINLAISSSGNSALSACEYLDKSKELFNKTPIKINLNVFVSDKLEEYKLTKLKSYDLKNDNEVVNIVINTSTKPTSDCIKYCNDNNAFNLRSSADDNAIIGYLTLGEEIANYNTKENEIDSIITTTSSGTSAIGLYLGYLMTKYSEFFLDLRKDEFLLRNILDKLPQLPVDTLPSLYICQTVKVHPIAKEFDKDYEDSPTSLINCVVDRIAKRKEDVIKIVNFSKGSGFVISDTDIEESRAILDLEGIDIPLNSITAFSGLIKSLKKGNIIKRPLIIVSGK